MSKKISRLLVVMGVIVLVLSLIPVTAQEKVQVVWFVGLGTGTNPEQLAMQETVVARFNESQSDIELVLNVAASYEAARDAITTLIASGNAPDIVGPVGIEGANAFKGSWLDLQPLVEASGYDLSQFPQATIDFYNTDEGLVGLPLATFPSFIFYNRALFDEAGLPYPPVNYGDAYIDADGNEHEWTVETMSELAMLLTVDAAGNDATSPDFDPENTVQWGFIHQDANLRNELAFFGAGHWYDAETGEAGMPEAWREEAGWYYDAMWNKRFVPNATQVASELLQGGGGAFSSGNVAMARSHLWYTCCLGDFQGWDIAPIPAYNGTITSSLHADTFSVMRTTKNPEATFEVLSYLVGEAALDLLSVYGGMPAREAERAAFFAGLDERYPQGVNWRVAEDSLDYSESPSHESWMPNFNKSSDREKAFQSLLASTPGLDVEAELETLLSDLAAIWSEVE